MNPLLKHLLTLDYKSFPEELKTDLLFICVYLLTVLLLLLGLLGSLLQILEFVVNEIVTTIQTLLGIKRPPLTYKCQNKVTQIIRKVSYLSVLKLLFVSRNSNLDVFNGIRVFCCLGIMWYHQYHARLVVGERFPTPIANQVNAMYFQHLGMLVDVFFFMSGFFNHSSLQKQFNELKATIPKLVIKSYATRFIRIYPTFFFSLIYWWKLYRFTGYNESFINANQRDASLDRQCNIALTLVTEDIYDCMQWAWYIRTEFIMYLILPLFAYIGSKSKILLLGVLVIGIYGADQNCIHFCSQLTIRFSDFTPSKQPKFGFTGDYNTIFNFPWTTHISVYLLGIISSLILPIATKPLKKFIRRCSKGKFMILAVFYSAGYLLIKSTNDSSLALVFNSQVEDEIHFSHLCQWRFRLMLGMFLLLVPSLIGIQELASFALARKVSNNNQPNYYSIQIYFPLSQLTYPIYLIHIPILHYNAYHLGAEEPDVGAQLMTLITQDILYIVPWSVFLFYLAESIRMLILY